MAWRLYDWYNLTVDEAESLWKFMMWDVLDLIFLFGLPLFQIPWLEWSNMTSGVLFLLHMGLNAMLMFRIGVSIVRPC